MQIPILVEPIADNRFRARSGEPLVLVAEGDTRSEALDNLKNLLSRRMAEGAEIVQLEVASQPENRWRLTAGIFREDDPLVQEWLETIEENRRKDEAEDSDLP